MNKTLRIIIILLFLVVITKLFFLMYIKRDDYKKILNEKTLEYVYLEEYPRGKILDINGNILVDNKITINLSYRKNNKITSKEEVNIATSIVDNIDINNKVTKKMLNDFYILTNDTSNLITKEEYQKFENRIINSDDIYNLKVSRIKTSYDERMQKIIYVYYLMQKGFYADNKIIKEDITNEEVIKMTNLNINSLSFSSSYERIYPYGKTIRNILGNISNNGISKELLQYYDLNKYNINDRVGISFLELQYDNYLQSNKSKYLVNSNNELIKVSDGNKGNDLILNIDINLVKKVEDILTKEILKTKKELNTDYYDHTYIIISNPLTGDVVVPLSLKILDDSIIDNSDKIISSSYTLGSVVKGASSSVNYYYNLLERDSYIKDSCVKLYLVPEKCSFKDLGKINDISALAYSSNYYQYLTAISLTNNKYKFNMKLNTTEEHFNKYRDMFKSYGLGTLTNIDLPNEKIGIIGNKISDDLLLNLSIGQYDTYTPVELAQYINTIASGKRQSLSILNRVVDDKGNIIYRNEPEVLNNVLINNDDLERIRTGFKNVYIYGTGKGYVKKEYLPAGKTGTSESFLDTNNNGVIDTKTITRSVALYFPYDNPKYSISIISPHLSHNNGNKSYLSELNRRLTKQITELLLEND